LESYLLRGRAAIQEDALTAALVDLLEDLADAELVAAVLGRLRPVKADGTPTHPINAALAPFDAFTVELWPDWKKRGEPDVAVSLWTGAELVAVIAIEVKYEAPKSGEDDQEAEELRDQLGRYAAALRERHPGIARKLVAYLTAESFPPVEELRSSWRAIEKKAGLDPAETLRWISWRDVDRTLREHNTPVDSLAGRRIDRVRRLLDRAGLRSFAGWPLNVDLPALPPPAPASWLGWRVDVFPPPLPPAPTGGLHGKSF
jgi:hypothetical protein